MIICKYFLQKVVLSTAREGWLAVCILLLASCHQGGGKSSTSYGEGDTIPMHYARLLTMVDFADHTEVTILNPWDTTQVLQHFSFNGSFQKAAVFSSVHCALMSELGVQGSVRGICDAQYNTLPWVIEGIHRGSIIDLGNSTAPNIERIAELQPDILMPSPFETSGGMGRMESLGIPVLQCADYMEVSPLARAEWIRLYGRLFGCKEEADSLFQSIEKKYNTLKERARREKGKKVSILAEKPFSGQWYVPCAESTMGIMYRDAGCRYLFDHLRGSGSAPQSIEQVLERGLDADIWLVKNYGKITRKQIVKDTPLLAALGARLYVADTSVNGYYEETPFHPERLLAEIIQIAYPESGITLEKHYFEVAE